MYEFNFFDYMLFVLHEVVKDECVVDFTQELVDTTLSYVHHFRAHERADPLAAHV